MHLRVRLAGPNWTQESGHLTSGGRFPSLESYPIPWINFAPDHNPTTRHNHHMAKQRFTDVRPAIEDMVTQMRELNRSDDTTTMVINLPRTVEKPPSDWLTAHNVKLYKPSWRERLRRQFQAMP